MRKTGLQNAKNALTAHDQPVVNHQMRVFVCCLPVLWFGLNAVGEACCAVAPRGVPVVNADQTVILLWDQERQMEHFIRKANFRSQGDSVGFLVPTPSRPQLEESGNEAFPYLDQITAPPNDSKDIGMPLSCAATPDSTAARSVRVIEEKDVAGFHAVVLAADSGKSLVEWLQQHDYAYTPEAAVWAEPYLAGKWYITAMKIAKPEEGHAARSVAAAALRISFKTDHPLFPYREPDSRKAADTLGVAHRLLRIYFVAEARYDGHFPSLQIWSGVPKWSQPLRADQRAQLLRHLALPLSTGPARYWLTELEDEWPYGQAPGDVYFSRASSQQTLARQGRTGSFDLNLPILAVLGLVRPLRRLLPKLGRRR